VLDLVSQLGLDPPDLIIALDGDGRIVGVNFLVEYLTGENRRALRGRELSGVIHGDVAGALQEASESATATPAWSLRGRRGEEFPAQWRVFALEPDDARGFAFLVVGYRPEESESWGKTLCPDAVVRRRKSQLDSFIYTLSHDLKTPVVSLTGWLSILEDEFSDALGVDGRSMIERMWANLRYLDRVIKDLLDFHRISTLRERPMEFSLRQLILHAVDRYEQMIAAKRISIDLPEEDATLSGEKGRVYIIVSALLENAILHMEREEDARIGFTITRGPDWVELRVSDNGVGIDPWFHDRIFEPFQRLHTDPEGTGMGLTLARRIAELHDGHLEVHSEPGQGATFSVRLPLRPALADLPWDSEV
jgi:signal transduction histidine kinase